MPVVPKKVPKYVTRHEDESTCCQKPSFIKLLMIIGAIIVITSSAVSMLGFMGIKMNGGKLPWES